MDATPLLWIVAGIIALVILWHINEATGWVFMALMWIIYLAIAIAVLISAGFLLHFGWILF